MSILVQLLKNTQAWALALLLTFTATSKAELLFSSNGRAITITGSKPEALGVLIIPTTINNLPVTSIGDGAFAYCSGLTSVTLPNSLTSIGQKAFAECSGLTSVNIPNNVTSISDYAFWHCTRLTRFSVDIANTTFSSNDGVLFNKAQTSLLSFPNGKARGYTIPDSVTSIGASAFYYCTGLTNITIGNSVTSIGDYAFRGCTGLTSVRFMGNAPTVGTAVFYDAPNVTLYYIAGKTGWDASFADRPTALSAPVEPPTGPVNTLELQVATDLTNPIWIPVATNSVPKSGAQQFYQMRASVLEVTVDLENPTWTPVLTNSLPDTINELFYRLVAR